MGQAKFEPRDYYQANGAYRLLPFQFNQFDVQRKFVVNEVGEYLFLDNALFEEFVEHRLDQSSNVYL